MPNGSYSVTVSVGDAITSDSTHRIRIEGQAAIAGFVPTSSNRFARAMRVVTGAGRPSVDAIGATNTRIDYVDVTSAATT